MEEDDTNKAAKSTINEINQHKFDIKTIVGEKIFQQLMNIVNKHPKKAICLGKAISLVTLMILSLGRKNIDKYSYMRNHGSHTEFESTKKNDGNVGTTFSSNNSGNINNNGCS